jgi:hypothetical protein
MSQMWPITSSSTEMFSRTTSPMFRDRVVVRDLLAGRAGRRPRALHDLDRRVEDVDLVRILVGDLGLAEPT